MLSDEDRLTYRSMFGDYGISAAFHTWVEERDALRNALGKYEDLGYTPEELREMINLLIAYENKKVSES